MIGDVVRLCLNEAVAVSNVSTLNDALAIST
jgi:hypothetical protein